MTRLIFCVLLLSVISAFGQTAPTMTVKVFFHNEKLNPNQEDCRKVFLTTRTIPKTTAVARAALDELFKGTTDEERKNEFWSFPVEDTIDIVKSLNVKGGMAYLNFKKIVFEKLGNTTTSCGGGFYPSIQATLKQFPTKRSCTRSKAARMTSMNGFRSVNVRIRNDFVRQATSNSYLRTGLRYWPV